MGPCGCKGEAAGAASPLCPMQKVLKKEDWSQVLCISHTFMKILVTLSRVLKSEKQEIAAKDRFPYSSKKYFGGCIYTHVAELFL